MTKATDIYKVRNLDFLSNSILRSKRVTVEEGWKIIAEQARAEQLRPATIRDYQRHYKHYIEFNNFHYVDEFNPDSIYKWLASMNVKDTTKRIRLKALKAMLSRLYNDEVIHKKFYKNIIIKVDEEVKEGATPEDIEKLLSCLDLTDYFQLRDATAVLLVWYTGIRAKTLSQLRIQDIDLEQQLMICPPSIMKNHHRLVMPLPDKLTEVLSVLIEQDIAIINEQGFDIDYLFFTREGYGWLKKSGGTGFSRQLNKYSKEFNIPNINPHAIRRGFAKRLLNEGVSVPVISKALGHSSLSTTTKYLNISEAELINELKRLH